MCTLLWQWFSEVELNSGELYLYHNSGTARRAINSNKIFGIGTPRYHFFNNLFWTESWWGNLCSDPPNWIGDYNVYVRRGESPLWDTQKNQAQAAGIDLHGRWAEGEISPYRDADEEDFRLMEKSPALDAGADAARLDGSPAGNTMACLFGIRLLRYGPGGSGRGPRRRDPGRLRARALRWPARE
ncbi:hypothetical protein OpiT1DRAFT_03142 [Opitutaceae bacterium TAV1]|nr:hypothetical protein OpiT1DRAFT_03142 [Opitutaceae bacterium TAV1]